MDHPFSPRPAGTVNIDVASTTANVQVTVTPRVRQIRVFNNGTATAWINFGNSSAVTAALASAVPVGAGVTEVLTVRISDGPIWAAAIAAGSTGKIYFTPGSGF